ncbi:hypothetical protein BSLG_004395 [Batrachochytrium salamandrivorans]|nr:hypothetical protein BSLG_004395 [Batrachochytrium salamandrivorans]
MLQRRTSTYDGYPPHHNHNHHHHQNHHLLAMSYPPPVFANMMTTDAVVSSSPSDPSSGPSTILHIPSSTATKDTDGVLDRGSAARVNGSGNGPSHSTQRHGRQHHQYPQGQPPPPLPTSQAQNFNSRARSASVISSTSTATSGHYRRQYGNSNSRGQQHTSVSGNGSCQQKTLSAKYRGRSFYMSTNIYVRKLAAHVTDASLVEMCTQYGKIVSSKAIIDPETHLCKGFGFVMYETVAETRLAMAGLVSQGYEVAPARIGPRTISTPLNDQDTSLYVSCLPIDMTEEGLSELFINYHPQSCRIMCDGGVSRGVGFIKLLDSHSAQLAIMQLDRYTIPGCTRPLRVRIAEPPGQRRMKHMHHTQPLGNPSDIYMPYAMSDVPLQAGVPSSLYMQPLPGVPWYPNGYTAHDYAQSNAYGGYYNAYCPPEASIVGVDSGLESGDTNDGSSAILYLTPGGFLQGHPSDHNNTANSCDGVEEGCSCAGNHSDITCTAVTAAGMTCASTDSSSDIVVVMGVVDENGRHVASVVDENDTVSVDASHVVG